MFCDKCGSLLSDSAKFCSSCGNKIQPEPAKIKCPGCGVPCDADMIYCENCGTKITNEDNTSSPAPSIPLQNPAAPSANVPLQKPDSHVVFVQPQTNPAAVPLQKPDAPAAFVQSQQNTAYTMPPVQPQPNPSATDRVSVRVTQSSGSAGFTGTGQLIEKIYVNYLNSGSVVGISKSMGNLCVYDDHIEYTGKALLRPSTLFNGGDKMIIRYGDIGSVSAANMMGQVGGVTITMKNGQQHTFNMGVVNAGTAQKIVGFIQSRIY